MIKVYSYVIAIDAGSAPNFEVPFATLAICKPMIRRTAEVGDVLVAFSGSRLSPEPHSVRWAGLVSEKLTFADYWRDARFTRKKPGRSPRPDNIYKPKGSTLIQIPNDVHGPKQRNRDTGGGYVLVFDPHWYFGASAPVLPASFGLRLAENARRGHRANLISSKQWNKLNAWLTKNEPDKITSSRHARVNAGCS